MLNVRDLIPWSRGRDVAAGRSAAEHPLVAFQREIDRLFDDFWRGFDLSVAGRARGVVTPRIDVGEDEKQIVVSAELLGMDEKDVELVLTENALTIKSEKKAEREERERGYTYMERSYGSFQRMIPFDAEVEADRVEATFKNGVLTVTLPKTPEAQKKFKKIPINVSGEGKESEQKAA